MKRSYRIALMLLALLIGFVISSCERKGREYGGVKKSPIGQINYTENSVRLASVESPSNVLEVSPNANVAPDGQALFGANCVACHQVTGQGIPGVFPPLDGSAYVTSDNVERIASIMLYGLSGNIKVKGMEYNGAMTPFSHLKNSELAAIATYVRSAWSNQSSAVDENVFASMRSKWGARGPFNITELGVEE